MDFTSASKNECVDAIKSARTRLGQLKRARVEEAANTVVEAIARAAGELIQAHHEASTLWRKQTGSNVMARMVQRKFEDGARVELYEEFVRIYPPRETTTCSDTSFAVVCRDGAVQRREFVAVYTHNPFRAVEFVERLNRWKDSIVGKTAQQSGLIADTVDRAANEGILDKLASA